MENTLISSPQPDLNPQFDFDILNPKKIQNHVTDILNHEGLSEDLKARMIRISDVYPENDFLLKRNGIGCISRGDIIVLKGPAKAGKSNFFICLCSALLGGELFGFELTKEGLKILYIDTEQNPVDTSILTRKVHALCKHFDKSDHPLFHASNLRSDSADERCIFILELVRYLMPDILIIDGTKDLIASGDVNDAKGSGKVMQFLMSLTKNYNLALLTSLHINKGDSNIRGHIGTEILNKCSECWQISKSGEIFDVRQSDCRHLSVPGFSFKYNDENLLVPVDHRLPMTKEKPEKNKFIETFRKCLPYGVSLTFTELKENIVLETKCKPKTAESKMTKAVNDGLIKKDAVNGRYEFNHQNEMVLPLP